VNWSAGVARPARTLLVLALVAALVPTVAAGCGGEKIHLGNGRGTADGGVDAGDGSPCQPGAIAANEVLWIGDSWLLIPGNQYTDVRDLARVAGAIGPNDDFTLAAAAGTTMSMIAGQYDTAAGGMPKPGVIIMDGGTWDTIVSNGSDASVSAAATAFTQFLSKVASDGTVDHIIYVLCPELANIPRVADLRPLMRNACAGSTVPCYFLDLQPLWVNHAEYTAAGDLFASETGASVVAQAIWSVMQDNCIAQ